MRILTFISLLFFAIPAHADEVYDRVMRTGEIRCAYVVWPGNFEVNPNTGEFSGIAYDIAEAIAAELDFKINWTEEVGWGTYAEGLNTGRYDMVCAPVWKSGQRAKTGLLTRTLFYENMYGMARVDDTRFDSSFEPINSPDVTVAVIDGDITQAIRNSLFPNSKELSLSPIAGSAPNTMSVATGKADITMTNRQALINFNAHNEKKLKLINDETPIRQFPSSFAVKRGEHDFKAMVDATIEALQTSGVFEQLIEKNAADLAPYQTNNR